MRRYARSCQRIVRFDRADETVQLEESRNKVQQLEIDRQHLLKANDAWREHCMRDRVAHGAQQHAMGMEVSPRVAV